MAEGTKLIPLPPTATAFRSASLRENGASVCDCHIFLKHQAIKIARKIFWEGLRGNFTWKKSIFSLSQMHYQGCSFRGQTPRCLLPCYAAALVLGGSGTHLMQKLSSSLFLISEVRIWRTTQWNCKCLGKVLKFP